MKCELCETTKSVTKYYSDFYGLIGMCDKCRFENGGFDKLQNAIRACEQKRRQNKN